MPFIGVQPATVPLTSSDITDGIISTAKIADDAVGNTKLDLSANYAFTGTVSGAGGIFQIKQATSTTQYDTSSTSISSSALNISITPSSTSNRILIWYSFAGHFNASSDFVISTLYKTQTGGTCV